MIEQTLTMIPGPTPVHREILASLSEPTVSHQAPEFVRGFRECLSSLRTITFADNARPFIVAGAGTLAMEMALVNLIAPGERLLVVSHGFFGDRWEQIGSAFGMSCDRVAAEWGSAVPAEELARRLDRESYAAVAMTHVDTSTGTAAPVAEYASLMRDREELVLVDGVCATAAMEERFDDWGLDVIVTGAQKAFGAPPGVALLVVSARAMDKRRSISSVPAYYADLLRWEPVMEDPARYFSTPPVNEVRALDRAMRIVLDEGLELRFDRHRRLARAVRAGLGALGLDLFTDSGCRADTLSVVRYPDGVYDLEFRNGMARRGVVIAGALGPIAGRACRIGHMGNIGPEEVCRVLQAVESTLGSVGEPGRAVAAAAPHLEG